MRESLFVGELIGIEIDNNYSTGMLDFDPDPDLETEKTFEKHQWRS
jgi:hypothetical protein